MCCAKAASLSGDSLLRRLRAAHTAGGGAAETASGGADDPYTTRGPEEGQRLIPDLPPDPYATRAPERGQLPIPDLPPELASHAQYEVLRELGRGGMGVVYLANNKLMRRQEVLKVVNPQLLARSGMAERFLREIRAAARLRHVNIATAYAALQVGELIVLAMEYVPGENLAKVVKERGPLPVVHACSYAQQIAAGLQHALEQGLVHRDIKPGNLVLARVGKRHVVKSLDFGLAKLTGSGQMLGTPDYIAPEQALDAAKADIRADIYSLGCTLYLLLSGTPPFKAKSLYEIVQAHVSRDATGLDEVRPEVPAGLAAVVAKMMAKDPAQRYQRPVEVAQALAPFVKAGAKAMSADVKSLLEKPTLTGAAPVRRDTLVGRNAATTGVGKKTATRPPTTPAKESAFRKWGLLGSGIGVAVLLLVLVGFWPGGVFRFRPRTASWSSP